MNKLRFAVLVLTIVASACVGDDPGDPGTTAGNDGGVGVDGGGTNDAGGDAAAVPAHGPTAVALAADSNLACSTITGDVTISRALDESDVTDYVLYWGSSPTVKIGAPITVVAKKGSDIVYSMTNTARPLGAAYLLAFSKNAFGELATGSSIAVSEVGQTVVHDISAAQASMSAQQLSTVIDAAGAKLLVAANDVGKPALFLSNLDGTNAAFQDISAGQGAGSGSAPVALVDTTNSKLLVVTSNGANSGKLALFRCNLDGTSCGYVDISAGQAANTGTVPTAVIDSVNHKLIVATQNGAPTNKLGLFICNLDGTNCAFHDASASQPDNSALDPSMAIDTINSKLLIVARNDANSDKPSLYRCDLGGTNCTHTDISAGRAATSGQAPSIVVDTVAKKLLTVTNDDSNGGRPALFRCDLDGTGCAYVDISAGQLGTGFDSFHPATIIDPVNKKLLVTTTKTVSPDIRAALYRCELDGTGCSYFNISPGSGQQYPTAAWNPLTQQLLTTFMDGANSSKLSLFSVCAY